MTSAPEPVPAPPPGAERQLLPFTEQLTLEADGPDRFLGLCHPSRGGVGFGGSALAQALAAAATTVPRGRPVHSLHAYFLSPVQCAEKVVYQAQRLRDGFSYSQRLVQAHQDQGPVLSMQTSFKSPARVSPGRPGYEQQAAAPRVPGPDGLPLAFSDHPARELTDALEVRFVPDTAYPPGPEGEVRQYTWSRMRLPLPDEPAYHACALAYLSDVTLAATALGAFRPVFPVTADSPPLRMASLDHAMWFHRPLYADQWLLFAQHSRTAADGRTLCRGEFWTEDGELVASAAQEALLYLR